METIIIGSDHAGFQAKEAVKKMLEDRGFHVKDVGCYSGESVHYPIYGKAVAKPISAGEYHRGILICGTGIGMSIVANKWPGVRAALCHNAFTAQACREHNDANVLAIGAAMVGEIVAMDIVDTFFATDFSHGERHQRRIDKIEC